MAPQPKPTAKQFAKELLLVAKSYLQRGWCTRALAQRANGSDCFVNDIAAVTWSLTGALQRGELHCAKTYGGGRSWYAYSEAVGLIQRDIPTEYRGNILRFGDAINQTQALAIIQRAGTEV